MSSKEVVLTGTEEFSELIESGAYYIDKTSFLKELFMGNSLAKNPLFLRPRRFGKTLNMSMIKEFCELNYQNPKDKSRQQRLFIDNGRNLAVAGDNYKELREQFMGEFPVISFSFKGIEGVYTTLTKELYDKAANGQKLEGTNVFEQVWFPPEEPTPAPTAAATASTIPQTSDEMPIVPIAIIAIAALLGLGVTAYMKKKQN